MLSTCLSDLQTVGLEERENSSLNNKLVTSASLNIELPSMVILSEFNPNWLTEELRKYLQVSFSLLRSGISNIVIRVHQDTAVTYNKVHQIPGWWNTVGTGS